MKSLLFKILFLVLIISFAFSCAPSRIASDLTSKIFKEGSPVFEMESDVEVAEISGLAMIKTLEVFHHHNPKNKVYLNLLAKSYGTYAFGFLENRMLQYQYSDPEKYQVYFNRARYFYAKGKEYGLKLLTRTDRGLVKALDTGVDAVRKSMQKYRRHQVEPVFWAAFSWGGLINLSKDDIVAVADLALVETMMARVVEVHSSFYFGGPDLFYGVYYAGRPTMLGGSPKKARAYFNRAEKSTSGRSLMVYALQAQYLALQSLDRSLFHQMIEKVNSGAINAVPEQRLANALAKQRVKFLKANERHYF